MGRGDDADTCNAAAVATGGGGNGQRWAKSTSETLRNLLATWRSRSRCWSMRAMVSAAAAPAATRTSISFGGGAAEAAEAAEASPWLNLHWSPRLQLPFWNAKHTPLPPRPPSRFRLRLSSVVFAACQQPHLHGQVKIYTCHERRMDSATAMAGKRGLSKATGCHGRDGRNSSTT